MTTTRMGRIDSSKSSTCLQLQHNNGGFSGKEAIPFTVKGPIPVHLPEANGDYGGRTGCSILELNFQYPSQIGELVFCNYYTAWMSVFVKRMANKIKTHPTKEKEISPSINNRARPVLERSFSIDVPGSKEKCRPRSLLPKLRSPPGSCKESKVYRRPSTASLTPDDDFEPLKFEMETLATGCLQHMYSKRRHSSGSLNAETANSESRPWELSIEMKKLMPWPHFECGSQDMVSIPATESMVEWRDVVVMRLVLHQPSTVWKRYTIEELNVFRHLPKRGFSHCDDIIRQRDNWFSMLKMNTKAVLTGQLVEPENNAVSEDGMAI